MLSKEEIVYKKENNQQEELWDTLNKKHVLDSSWAQRGNLFLNSPMTSQFRPQTTFFPTLDIYSTSIRSKSFRFPLPFPF